jgi:predicted dehydrogenase
VIKLSRRKLLCCSAAGIAGAIATPYLLPSGVLAADGKPGANQRITIGVIGVGRRARQLIDQLPESAQIASVADCFLTRCTVPYRYVNRDAAERKKPNWRIHQDYRKLLDEKDIDAVIVATTDHNRVLACIRACQAGKDIYAEKPLTLYVSEGRALIDAVRRHNRILQVGTQQRSMAINRVACEFVRNGGLGKLRAIKAINYAGPNRIPRLPAEPTPKDLDWDLWLGQAELRPFRNEFYLGWMGWRDYSGGEITNMGAHGLDQVQWALDRDQTGPVEFWPVTPGIGGKVSYRYADGIQVDLELAEKHGPDCGAVFVGSNGKLEINRNKIASNPKGIALELLGKINAAQEERKWRDEIALHSKNSNDRGRSEAEAAKWRAEVALWQAKLHLADWLNCIKTRQRPVADVEIGHRTISVCHLCNIAHEVGRKIKWDPRQEQIVGDEEANKLLNRPRRKGYELPASL